MPPHQFQVFLRPPARQRVRLFCLESTWLSSLTFVCLRFAGTIITINGQNFGSDASKISVTFNGQFRSAVTMITANTQISFPSIALGGSASSVLVVVTVNGQTSLSVTYAIAPPTVSGMLPSTAPTAGGMALTVTGTQLVHETVDFFPFKHSLPLFDPGLNFGTAPTLQFNNNSMQLLSSTHTQVIFTVPAGYGTQIPITVQANGQLSLVTNSSSLSYSAPKVCFAFQILILLS